MRTVILCPGPSLARACPSRAGLVIAVNRAISFYGADVWAAGDIPMLTDQKPDVIGQPELFTAAATHAHLRKIHRPWPWRTTEFESLFGFLEPASSSWTMFTFTAAIVYAANEGSTEIEIHGCDWAGVEDFDGWHEAGNRTAARWKLEREIYARLIPLIQNMGIHVERVAPMPAL